MRENLFKIGIGYRIKRSVIEAAALTLGFFNLTLKKEITTLQMKEALLCGRD